MQKDVYVSADAVSAALPDPRAYPTASYWDSPQYEQLVAGTSAG